MRIPIPYLEVCLLLNHESQTSCDTVCCWESSFCGIVFVNPGYCSHGDNYGSSTQSIWNFLSTNTFSPRKLNNYRPQTKLRQGNVFTPVCHSVHGWGGCMPDTPEQTQPGRHLPGRHPPGQTLLTPWVDTPRQTPPLADNPLRHFPPFPGHARIHKPPGQCMLGYGQQAGSMHPTGMHSCLF